MTSEQTTFEQSRSQGRVIHGVAGNRRRRSLKNAFHARLRRTPWRSGRRLAGIAGFLALLACVGSARAATIAIPNGSFESPVTPFVDIRIDSWQKAAKPFWHDESSGFLWDQLVGVFKNTAPGSADHIDNCAGNQAIFLFAVPQVSLFQDYSSTNWSSAAPTHEFNAKYEVGKSYELTVGVIGGGGAMTNGVTMEISLYYRDAASNLVTVAATSITNSPALFPTTTHFVDFRVPVPVVQASDSWAGQHIGVRMLSTVNPALAGGFWDLDNVRLTATSQPVLLAPALSGGKFGFTLQSEPGLKFELQATTDLATPSAEWVKLGTLTNTTGSMTFTEPAANSVRRFYRARQLP